MKPTALNVCSTVVSFIAALCFIATSLLADEPDASTGAGSSIETHWEALLGQEPESTLAIIGLIKTPAETVAFLEKRLQPLELTSDHLHSLLDKLQSSDVFIWRSAYRELEYLDPRLALGIEDLLTLDSMKQSPGRNRLASILIGFPLKSYKTVANRKFFKLIPVGDDEFNLCCSDIPEACGTSYWAESKIHLLGNGSGGSRKPEWNRIIRAICLLEYFGTHEAFAIISRMSEGHPDARPTRFAKDVLARNPGAEP